MLRAVITFLGQLPTVSKQTWFGCLVFGFVFFFNSIFEILQFWRNVCLNVWGRLVLQTEEQRAQLHNSKAEKIEFVILTARS